VIREGERERDSGEPQVVTYGSKKNLCRRENIGAETADIGNNREKCITLTNTCTRDRTLE